MKLSVIIVNYNVKYFLEQCLHTVTKAIGMLDAEVIVVDNNSADKSLEYLAPRFPSISFSRSEQNLGFGKANNRALRSSKGEYILFLNPDTLVPEDCFEKCLTFLDHHQAAGALGIRMIDGTGKFLPESKRSFPTTLSAFYKLAGLSGLFPSSKYFNRYSLNYLDENHDHSVEVLAGAFLLVRRAVLEQVGAFDEQFFMYGEDIDLSYRIKKAGFENWYFSGSTIVHFKGESTKKESGKYLKMFYEAMMVFVNKHYKGQGAWIKRSLLKTGIAMRAIAGWLFIPAAQNRAVHETPNRIVIGNSKSLEECLRILQHDLSANILHFPETEITHLSEKLQSAAKGEIIFCTPDIPMKDAINIMQTQGSSSFTYRFHSNGSNSIIGSDSKESVGETHASD